MRFLKVVFSVIFVALLTCKIAAASDNQEILNIDLKTSKYMKLDKKITRIAVGDAAVAKVLQIPGSPNEFLVVAKGAGSTTLFVWTVPDDIQEYIINVSPEDKGLAQMIKRAIGLPYIQVKVINNDKQMRILLTGSVRNQYERNFAVQTARLYAGGKGSESSLSVGSGFDMSIETQNTVDGKIANNGGDIGGSAIQGGGEVIDLLHMMKPTQIKLEAQVIAIRPQDKKNLGILYGNDAEDNPGVFSISETSSGLSFGHSTWSRGNINVSINALVTKNLAKILSRPSITTMSGEKAIIQVGGQIPYYTYDDNNKLSVYFKDYGIILQLKPVTDSEDRITSTIHAEVSNMSGETVGGNPILDVRRADSVVTVRSGSTMIIGGLMDSSERKTVNKFPFLGDIPILGEFFKYTSKSKDKQELIILVTPYIVDDDEISRARMSESLQDIYNRGLEEKNSLNDVYLNEPFEKDEPFENH